MSDKKLSVFIKTTPSSMGFLQKLDVNCGFCTYCIEEDYPLCFHGGCAVVEYITDRIGKENVTHDVKNTQNPSVSIIAKNIDSLGRAYKTATKAIEYCTGKNDTKTK